MSDPSTNGQTHEHEELADEVIPGPQELCYSELLALAEKRKQENMTELASELCSRAKAIKEADEKRAVAILSNEEATPEQMLKLAKRLAGYKDLGYARRVLDRALSESNPTDNSSIYPELFQKGALYTYKDPDLPAAWRLDRALNILKGAGGAENLARTRNQETLGIAGAIYKRKWEVDGQRRNLERSLLYYLKGYAQGAPTPEGREDILEYLRKTPKAKLNAAEDRGYTGINAAFILDLLAQQEKLEALEAKLPSETSTRRQDDAQLIRAEITRSVPSLIKDQKHKWLEKEWWFYATIGEAFFGLGDYAKALEWLVTKPAEAGLLVPEWEYESTARQLAQLALLQHPPNISEKEFEKTDTWEALKGFLKEDEKKVRSAFRGKFGLALSGGGFRASLYHVGVLARLAELDVLRHVEVLSCVSGGSITGAYYYLELRKLLQTRRDDDIKPEDYVQIVEKIEEQLLKGIERNIRTRVFAEFTTNLKLVFWPGYSRTRRVGELYERELFSRIEDEGKHEGWRWIPTPLAKLFGLRRPNRYLNELYIYPFLGANELDRGFAPKNHNWKRHNKVPSLILNATSLNTGHVWQFTASYMGEPPDPANSKIDSNYRLRRMYYKDAPEPYRKVRLGYAVAASAGVPALFEPLTLDSLYPYDETELDGKLSVQLVDGGVYDNQGIASLLEQDCTVLLVSDASGQMESESLPSGKAVNVLWRSNDISMTRVRGIQYNDALARKNSSLLRGLMFIHLKQELRGRAIAWKDCPDDLRESEFEREQRAENSRTSYGISTDIQRLLAAVRTDLDSFSEAEAYALMASGYYITKRQFEGKDKCVEGFTEEYPGTWKFTGIRDSLQGQGKGRKHLQRLLKASSSRAFKIWQQSLPFIILKWILGLVVLSVICYGFYRLRKTSILPAQGLEWATKNLTFGRIGIAILITLGLMIVRLVLAKLLGKVPAEYIVRALRWRNALRKIAIGIAMCLLGWLAVRIHLHIFDYFYLRHGRLNRFPK